MHHYSGRCTLVEVSNSLTPCFNSSSSQKPIGTKERLLKILINVMYTSLINSPLIVVCVYEKSKHT